MGGDQYGDGRDGDGEVRRLVSWLKFRRFRLCRSWYGVFRFSRRLAENIFLNFLLDFFANKYPLEERGYGMPRFWY